MSDALPALRRADCGHYIPGDTPPAGTHIGSEDPVYLCDECRERAGRHQKARVETKEARPTRKAQA